MSLIKLGSPVITLQPDWEVDEDEHGLLTGTVTYEGDWAYRHLIPALGSLHRYDRRLTCYGRTLKQLRAEKVRGTLKYIGITGDPTAMFIEHPGGSGQDPIETHPDFADFAGTPGSPLNGAYFDPDSDAFVGFTDPTNDLAGVSAYIVPSVMINLSFYTHYIPQLSNVGKLYNWSIPNLIRPPNVRNFLLIGMPYRQIGNLFQVTHQVLGSGPNGWNRTLY